VLETLHSSSNASPQQTDIHSRFWNTYERVARQYDEDFIEKNNGSLDVLLIFVRPHCESVRIYLIQDDLLNHQAGLFSSVSSTFIVAMGTSFQPNANDTTNALLALLVTAAYNGTRPISSPLNTASSPTSDAIWIQGLAYASLTFSLLAAFGAVLSKQWLGHYKSSRFGHGTQEERCLRRQLQLAGMDEWHFHFILDVLPMLLQLSLLFFAIALAGNIYSQQQILGLIIMLATAFGLLFYLWTSVIGLRHHTAPFQDGLTKSLRRPLRFLFEKSELAMALISARCYRILSFAHERQMATASIPNDSPHGIDDLEPVFPGRLPSGLLSFHLQRTTLFKDMTGQTVMAAPLDVDLPLTAVEQHGYHVVRWILETSTDPEVVTAAANMVIEVFWPRNVDRSRIFTHLRRNFEDSFSYNGQLTPLMRHRAEACYMAMIHLRCTDLPVPAIVQETWQDYLLGEIWLANCLHRLGLNFQSSPHLLMINSLSSVSIANQFETEGQWDKKQIAYSDWVTYIIPFMLHKGDIQQLKMAEVIRI